MRDEVDTMNDPRPCPGRAPGNRPALRVFVLRTLSDGHLMRKKHCICFSTAIGT
jgi:hypothetical protein